MGSFTPPGRAPARPAGPPIVGRPYFEDGHPAALPRLSMPQPLRFIVPSVGSIWAWEPLKPNTYCHLRVTATKWNGLAWIDSIPISHGPNYGHRINYETRRHTLSTWVESTVLVSDGRHHLPEPAVAPRCVCGLEQPMDCPVHEHEHCLHGGVCCTCEFGVAHTQWQRT